MNYWIIVFFSLVITNFFGAFEVPKILVFALLVFYTILCVSKQNIFRNIIILFFLSLFLSMISSNLFRGQSYIESLKSCLYYFNLLFYFVLIFYNPNIRQVEKAIRFLAVIFIVCYLIQYIAYPTVIFSGANREFYNDEIRIRLTGQGIISLGYFYFINKFFVIKNNRFFNACLAFFCLVVVFLMGFRTMLIFSVFYTLVLMCMVFGITTKLLVSSISFFIAFFIVLQIPVFSKVIDDMQERQKVDNFSNSDYIRVLQFDYYTTSHFKNKVEYFFGSGQPYRPASDTGKGGSKYGRQMETLVDNHLNWFDLGIISTAWIIGIPAVSMLIIMVIIAVKQKLRTRYKYLTIWFIYLLSVSFTTIELVRPGNFEIIAIALFAIVAAKKNRFIKIYKRNENRYFNIS